MMIAILAAAAPGALPGYEEVQSLDLTTPFHTRAAWTMRLMQPVGRDADIGDRPAKVCLTGGRDGATHCQDVAAEGYGFQRIQSAAVEPLSAKAHLLGVAVKAEYSGGAHTLRRTDMWTYNAAADNFERTSGFSRSDLGDEERFASGPMDGFYMLADFLLSGDETRWSEHRYSVEIYKLDPRFAGYIQVLQYLSPGTYRAERNGPHEVIDGELARARRMLAAVYPKGLLAGLPP
jgi:hypothetical protein